MIIYIDIIFLKNFIINLSIFKITDMILQEKSKLINKILASIIVSVYSILVIMFNLKIINNTFGKIALSIIIVTTIYAPKDLAGYIQKTMTLYVVTYFLGGIMESLFNKTQNCSFAIFLSIIICSILLFLFKEFIKEKYKKSVYTCNVKIIINEKPIMAKAFIDSGLQLQDVITGENVIIINEDKIEEISIELFLALKGISLNIPQEFQTRIRMITYSSLGNQGDILYGVKADSVVIYYEGKEIENKNVIVAVNEDEFKDYEAIIGLNIIEGGNVIGNSAIVKVKS